MANTTKIKNPHQYCFRTEKENWDKLLAIKAIRKKKEPNISVNDMLNEAAEEKGLFD